MRPFRKPIITYYHREIINAFCSHFQSYKRLSPKRDEYFLEKPKKWLLGGLTWHLGTLKQCNWLDVGEHLHWWRQRDCNFQISLSHTWNSGHWWRGKTANFEISCFVWHLYFQLFWKPFRCNWCLYCWQKFLRGFVWTFHINQKLFITWLSTDVEISFQRFIYFWRKLFKCIFFVCLHSFLRRYKYQFAFCGIFWTCSESP